MNNFISSLPTDILTELKTSGKKIAMYGTGDGADRILDILNENKIKVSAVFASDGFVRDRTFRGFKVESYSHVKKRLGSFETVMAFGSSRPEVIENALKIKNDTGLSAFWIPPAGGQNFTLDFVKKNRDKFKEAENLLADDFSKKVFSDVINFRLTGNIDYLFDCETEKEEDINLLRPMKSPVYADIGAYNGDTVIEFSKYFPDYNKIFAFEPDEKNFRKLRKNTDNLKNVEIFNEALSDENGYMMFSGGKGRGSSGATEGGKKVRTAALDNEIKGGVNLIKFDVEGLEEKALIGSEKIIREYKPKIILSCYHKSDDIFSLPLLVNSFRKDYKFYLRRNRCIPDWDMCFYIV